MASTHNIELRIHQSQISAAEKLSLKTSAEVGRYSIHTPSFCQSVYISSFYTYKMGDKMGWQDGSMANTGCSCREPGFDI